MAPGDKDSSTTVVDNVVTTVDHTETTPHQTGTSNSQPEEHVASDNDEDVIYIDSEDR